MNGTSDVKHVPGTGFQNYPNRRPGTNTTKKAPAIAGAELSDVRSGGPWVLPNPPLGYVWRMSVVGTNVSNLDRFSRRGVSYNVCRIRPRAIQFGVSLKVPIKMLRSVELGKGRLNVRNAIPSPQVPEALSRH